MSAGPRSEAGRLRAKIRESVKARRIDPSLAIYDPLDQKREEKRKVEAQIAVEKAAPTLAKLADDYLAWARDNKRPASLKADRSFLSRILPLLGTRKLADLTRGDIERLKRGMADTPILFNRSLALLSAMLNHAIREKDLPKDYDNPCSEFPKYDEPESGKCPSMKSRSIGSTPRWRGIPIGMPAT